ncbi:MAG: DNA-directed RNA polymerase subunit K [Candidatus Aenigmarchaeota archaeon]|nr:DNA-directed RNA polymerase subunit K [Candidatus Aenigmarchaeota archaeon]
MIMVVPDGVGVIWPKDRVTRFEVARIIGARALQITLGAPILVKVETNEFDPIKIAEEEFKAIRIPMTIKRTLPSGEVVVVDIKSATKNWLEDHGGEI